MKRKTPQAMSGSRGFAVGVSDLDDLLGKLFLKKKIKAKKKKKSNIHTANWDMKEVRDWGI